MNTKKYFILLAVAVIILGGTTALLLTKEPNEDHLEEATAPVLELMPTSNARLSKAEFVTWTASEKAAWSETSLRKSLGEAADLHPGINFVHLSPALAAKNPTLNEVKKYIDPDSKNMLVFIYRNGFFVGPKSGPYNPSNIKKETAGIKLKVGEALIVVSQGESKAYGFLPASEAAVGYLTLAKGWNLVAYTNDVFSALAAEPERYKSSGCQNLYCDAESIWFLTDEQKSTFKKIETLTEGGKNLSAQAPTFVGWVNNGGKAGKASTPPQGGSPVPQSGSPTSAPNPAPSGGGGGGGGSSPAPAPGPTPGPPAPAPTPPTPGPTPPAPTPPAGAPAPGPTPPTPPPSSGSNDISFFVTSTGSGEDGGNYGGLAGADARCFVLATAAFGSVGSEKTWRAYLSNNSPRINAIDRIGSGPWRNFAGKTITKASLTAGIAYDDLLDEHGDKVQRTNEHDIVTGSDNAGQLAIIDGNPHTCGDWLNNSDAATTVGHADWDLASPPQSWNSAHTVFCSAAAFRESAGVGRLYCFAAN